MSSDARRRAEQIFQRAIELPPDDRAAFLDSECAADPNVRTEVDSLLRHADQETIVSLRAPMVGDVAGDLRAGDRVDRYRLLELIGEGGFGRVYMAEQQEPVRRKVALKIIKLGMDTRQVIARFEAERQALALMDHPNIARVFDAGTTERGRPYFVMELVRGIPITDYCDQNKVPLRERVALIATICRAVQHAHQKGIIHRDIKPSNLLVTMHDGRPVPKIIDFGIAKATGEPLTDRTLFTEFKQFIGTPEYMSPEQAEMSGLDIDTRSDLYSLGVVLYELLAGSTPFDARKLRSSAFSEIQRIIREEDPPRPSQRVSSLGETITTIARARRIEPAALRRSIRGDLDWIVMRALEKDRTRRYETASGMANDLQRYLDDQPVLAGPPSAAYKLRKFIHRNRAAVAGVSVVAFALLGGLAFATVGFVQANQARARAEESAAAALAINQFFNDMLNAADPLQMRLESGFRLGAAAANPPDGGLQRDASVAEMVSIAGDRIDEIFGERRDLKAVAHDTVGMMLRGSGRIQESLPHLQAAHDIIAELHPERAPETIRARFVLGEALSQAGRMDAALPLIERSLEHARGEYGDDDPRTLSMASSFAAALADDGRFRDAVKVFERTLAQQRAVLGPDNRDTLMTMFRWSILELQSWNLDRGLQLAREVSERAERSLGRNDAVAVMARPVLGWYDVSLGEFTAAEEILRNGLADCRRILGADHPLTLMTQLGLARALFGTEHLDERAALERGALEGLRRARGPTHWHTLQAIEDVAGQYDARGLVAPAEELYRELLRGTQGAYGEASLPAIQASERYAGFLERIGRFDQAISLRRELIALQEANFGPNAEQPLAGRLELASALTRLGRLDEARREFTTILTRRQSVIDAGEAGPLVLNNQAWVLLIGQPPDMRDPARALVLAEKSAAGYEHPPHAVLDTLALAYFLNDRPAEAIEVQRRAFLARPKGSDAGLNYGGSLVRYLSDQGYVDVAARVVRESVAAYRRSVGPDNPRLVTQFERAARELIDSGDFQIAEPLLVEALRVSRRLGRDEHPWTANALGSLADVYFATQRYAAAIDACRQAADLRLRLYGPDDVRTASTQTRLAEMLALGHTPEAALSILKEAVATCDRLGAARTPLALVARHNLAYALIRLGRLTEAAPLVRDLVGEMRHVYGDGHWNTALALRTQAQLLLESGSLDQAELLLRESLAVLESLAPARRHAEYAHTVRNTLGDVLLRQGRFAEAEPLLIESHAALADHYGDVLPETRLAVERLVRFYEATNDPRQARTWRARIPRTTTITSF